MVIGGGALRQHGYWESFIIHPLQSKFMKIWEPTLLLALIFTGVVTPFEVSFLHDQGCVTPLWVLNRLLDVIFVSDMLITFRTAVYDERLGRWSRDGRFIAYNYLTGFFVVDLLSILPLWPVPLLTTGCPSASVARQAPADASSLAGAARIFRLVRLLRLARMVKAVRVLTRQLTDFFMVTLEGTYGGLKFMKLVLMLLCVAHWQACLFGAVELFADTDEPTRGTWLRVHREVHGNTDGSAFQNYILALYMSIGILTGLGADDILPTTIPERTLNLSCKFASGCLWAWAIGEAAAIASTLNPYQVFFHNNMDRLNLYLRDKGLPKPLRLQAREYFENARGVHAAAHDASLLAQMSPLLRGEIALSANSGWIEQVWFLRGIGTGANASFEEREFIVRLSAALEPQAFLYQERLPLGLLYILRKGVVVKLWRFIKAGRVFGEDALLTDVELIDHSQAVAMTYAEAYSLHKDSFDGLAALYPEVWAVVSKRLRNVALRRSLIRYLRLFAEDGDDEGNGPIDVARVEKRRAEALAYVPRSFIPRSAASGYEWAPGLQAPPSAPLGPPQSLPTSAIGEQAPMSDRTRSHIREGGGGGGHGGGGGANPRQLEQLGSLVQQLARSIERLDASQREIAASVREIKVGNARASLGRGEPEKEPSKGGLWA